MAGLPELDETALLLEEVREELARRKLPIPSAPELETPPIPGDLTSVSGEYLMELMVAYRGLADYAETEAAKANTPASAKANALRVRKAELYLELREEKNNGARILNEEIPARIDTHPDLKALRHELLKAEAYRDMVRVLAKAYDDRYALLSRELSRRMQRGERE